MNTYKINISSVFCVLKNPREINVINGVSILNKNIKIRLCKKSDREKIIPFFHEMITDTFIQNKIDLLTDDLSDEIESKISFFGNVVEGSLKNENLYVAELNNSIVGTIRIGKSTDLMNKLTNGLTAPLYSFGSVLIHKQQQKQGVVNLLLLKVFQEFKINNISEVCFDCGYEIAQKIWSKKFGAPTFAFQNFYGDNTDHTIWIVEVEKSLQQIKSIMNNLVK